MPPGKAGNHAKPRPFATMVLRSFPYLLRWTVHKTSPETIRATLPDNCSRSVAMIRATHWSVGIDRQATT